MDIHEDSGAPAKRGFLELPLPASFRTGMAQNIIVGFVCFCCPGMFNAMQVRITMLSSDLYGCWLFLSAPAC
jgi:hypothetical protein